jgi:hypothetical protein
MNVRQAYFAAALLAGSLMMAPPASAQCAGLEGLGFGYGGYLGVGDLYRVLSQNVPHFAAFPPVYYSAPVPRTYGYSPFAYLPHVRTPEIVQPVMPVTIENPYFTGGNPATDSESADTASPADQTTQDSPARQPLEVSNPFYRPGTVEVAVHRRQR